MRIDLMLVPEPASESGRELRVDPHFGGSSHVWHPAGRIGPQRADLRGQNRMIQLTGRIQETGRDVVGLQVRVVRQDLIPRFPSGQKLEDVEDTDTHSADARTAPALLRVNRDPAKKIRLAHVSPRSLVHMNLPASKPISESVVTPNQIRIPPCQVTWLGCRRGPRNRGDQAHGPVQAPATAPSHRRSRGRDSPK